MPIAILFGLVVMAILLPTLMTTTQQNSTIVLGTVAAQQLKQLTAAAQQYIQTNFSAVLGASSTTTPATITVPMLISTGFLPQGFQALNPYGQTWQVEALQAPAGQIQALVMSTGGTPVPTRDAARITAQAGAEGGIVGGGTGNLASPTCAVGQACGAFGGWRVATSGYTGLGPGSLLGLLAFNSAGQLNQQYLYRVAVPGQPQLNQMQTNLDMGNNSVNNANNVTAAGQVAAGTLNVSGNGNVGGSVTMANGRVVAWNQVPEGGVLQLQGANGVNMFLESLNGTFRLVNNPWNAQLFSVDQSGNVVAASSYSLPSGATFDSDQGGSLELGAGNTTAGSGGPYIDFHLGGQGIQDFNARIQNDSNDHLMIYGINGDGSLGVQGTLQPGNVATLGAGCSPNGQIAANANGSGQLMSCVNGTWTNAQGSSFQYVSWGGQGTWFNAGNGNQVFSPYWYSSNPTTVYGIAYDSTCGSSPGRVYVQWFNSSGANIWGPMLLASGNYLGGPDGGSGFNHAYPFAIPVPSGSYMAFSTPDSGGCGAAAGVFVYGVSSG